MEIRPHPQLLEALFIYKSSLSTVFKDILGIYEINHIAISQINSENQILSFSSTPAMEFNLFNSELWRYDKSYSPEWFTQCTQAPWESLYAKDRYDELYYLKQLKHHYPIGQTMAAKSDQDFFIYSFASHRSCNHTRELFANCYDDFYKIGQYCSKMLSQLFQNYNSLPTNTQVEYETSD